MFSVIRLFSFAWLLLSFLSFSVRALPLGARQNGDSTTVMTVHSTMTPAGPMTETCVITLTPITDKDGNPAVEEVKRCKLTVDSTNNGSAGGGDTDTSTTTDASTEAPTSTLTDSTAEATSGTVEQGNPAISVNGFTTVTASSQATSTIDSSSDAASSAPAATGNPAISVNGFTSVPASGLSSAASSLGTVVSGAAPTSAADTSASVSAPAADASGSATAAFQVPGTRVSVLPIGLGVFAGISVIALIVVGLVTYERTKYRKAFRQRKLAESGAAMGYGGMAQRS